MSQQIQVVMRTQQSEEQLYPPFILKFKLSQAASGTLFLSVDQVVTRRTRLNLLPDAVT